MEKPLDKYINENEMHWPLWINRYQFGDVDNATGSEATLLDFILNRLSFGYRSPLSNDFMPILSYKDGKRTPIYDDLEDSDFELIKQLVTNTTNIYLLAKSNDLLFLRTKEKHFCNEAVRYHLLIADHFINSAKIFSALNFIKRSLFLLKSVSDHAGIAKTINKFVFETHYADQNDVERIINSVFDFFKRCSYSKYDKKRLINFIESHPISDSDEGLSLIQNVIDFYSSSQETTSQNQWRNKYADICERLCEQQSPRGYGYLKRAIEVLLKQEALNEERIDMLRFSLEEEQKRLFESMQFQEIPIDEGVKAEIDAFLQKIKASFERESDSLRKFSLFLEYFQPVRSKELASFAESMDESPLEGLFTQVLFDENGRIVDEIDPEDKEGRAKQNYVQAYHLFHAVYYPIALSYSRSVTVDDQLASLIKDIVSHNEIVPPGKTGVIQKYILKGLSMDFRQADYYLISLFERGCIHFLKNRKKVYPEMRRGSHSVTADLNHILVQEKFRKHIVAILGEDLTKELRFLLVEKRYGNLRNKYYHEGIDKIDAFTNIEVLAFYRLLNAYCMAYDNQINVQ